MHNQQATRIVHLITALGVGGAELKLYRLLRYLQAHNTESIVVSLAEVGPVGKKIEQLGVPVVAVGIKSGKLPTPYRLLRLLLTVRKARPDIVQGWMYHGNLAATIAWLFCRRPVRLIWNVRQSLGSLESERLFTRQIIRINSWLSRIPERIVYNSTVSASQHQAIGFECNKTLYIPNGFDIKAGEHASTLRRKFRKDQGIDEHTILIGHIARYHPKKDHETFIQAARLVLMQNYDVKFIAAGREVDQGNKVLWNSITKNGLEKHILLVGEISNVERVIVSLDLLVSSSSWGEGCPNVVGEAMAASVPCVVTDVGDSAHLVGNTGIVAEPRKPEELGISIVKFLQMSREDRKYRGQAARSRIKDKFSTDIVGKKYLQLYCFGCYG